MHRAEGDLAMMCAGGDRMSPDTHGPLGAFFRLVIAKRWWIVLFYALLLPLAVRFALEVDQDNSLDRLIVQDDPDYVTSKEFEKVFGQGEYIILLAEADDPFSPAVLARIDDIEGRLRKIPGVEVNSGLSVYRKA